MPSALPLIRATMSQRIAPPLPFDATKMYGLDGFSPANYFATSVGGGEMGAVTGFVAAVLCVVKTQAVASQARPLLDMQTESPAGGYSVSTKTTNATASSTIASDAPALITSGAYTIAAGNVDKFMLFVLQHSGGQQHENRFFVNNANVSRTSMTGYTAAPSAPTYLGAGLRSGSLVGSDGVTIYEAATFTGAPYLADVTAWADAVRAAGDLSPALAKATQTHRWSLKVELAKSGVAIADGAAAPAVLPDIVTGLAEHALSRQGALVVRAGLPAWSW